MGASPIPPRKGRANQLTEQQGISSRLFSPLHFALRQKLGGVGRGSVFLLFKISSKIIRNFNYLKEQSCCFVTKVLLYVTLQKNNREITCVVLIFC